MNIILTWHNSLSWNSNERLVFDVINKDIATFFVETSEQLGNEWTIGDQVTDIPRRKHDVLRLIDEINLDVDRVNEFLTNTGHNIIKKPDNWFEQKQLNKLHKDWAKTRQAWPTLPGMLHKVDSSLYDCYQEMNCHIHLIEQSFLYNFRDPSHWRVPNIFKDTWYEWEEAHLSLEYPGHGRNAFEKFENDDDSLEDIEIDNCNWDNMDAYLRIRLRRPHKLTPPEEFLNWCANKSMVPHRHTIAIGNLVESENTLTTAREMFVNNIKAGNSFSLEIV